MTRAPTPTGNDERAGAATATAASNLDPAAEPAPLIEFREVVKRFAGRAVLAGMNLRVRRGERLFLIGTSGVGKSVAIKLLIGLLRIDGGELWFDHRRIDTLGEAELPALRRRVGMVFQHSTLLDAMTLLDNVALPLRKHGGMRQAAARAEAAVRLAAVQMAEHADRYPAEVSDGMRKRVAIARTLAMNPEVVLFDEPTTGLDPVSARHIDEVIRHLPGRAGVTSIVVSHDLVSIMSTADRIALLYQGVVYALGTPTELAASTDPIVAQFLAGRSHGPMETPGF
jgi:phospholipid/cholesterol/gamma-HCH transport system ATP-binding protein